MTIAVLFFVLVTFVADLLGVNFFRSFWSNFERMEGWLTIVHLAAFFIVTSAIFGHYETNKKIWHRWLASNLGVATIVGIYGLLQLANVLAIHQGSTRVDASLGNSAYMAVYMLFSIGIAVFLFLSSNEKWNLKLSGRDSAHTFFWSFLILSLVVISMFSSSQEMTAFFGSLKTFAGTHTIQFLLGLIVSVIVILYPYRTLPIFFTFMVFETQTRGTILGLIGGIMLSLFLYAILAKKDAKVSRAVSGGIIILIILTGIIFWTNRTSSFVKNNEVLNRLATISLSDVKTQARGYIWPMAIKGAMERPIFGWGQENFNYIFNANYQPAMYDQEQWFDRAHSVFLDWLVAGGFIGLISYLALYVLLFVYIWKSSFTIAEKSVFTGLIVGYMIHNVFVFDNIASYIMFFAILSLFNSQSENKHNKELVILGSKTYNKDAIEYVVLPIVVVGFICIVYFAQYRLYLSNTRLINALYSCSGRSMPDAVLFEKALSVDSYTANQEIREQLLNCANMVIPVAQVPGPTKQAFFQLSQDQIEAQIKATPKDARIYALGGMFMSGIGQTDEAVKLLEQAHKLSPTKQSIIVPLATAYINSGKEKEAVNLLKVAYESAPENTNVKSTYVIALVISGQEKEARKIAGDDKSIFESQQMGQVYATLKQYSKSIEIYKSLIKADPTNLNYFAQLAQVQYTAGLKYDSVETLRALEKIKPELKDQIESSIKQILK
jgi:tetratricopeptide (TPR) repeat protein